MTIGVKTGGRQKGTRNRLTAEAVAAAVATGITPLEFMLAIMRNEELGRPERMDAAKAAAPYVHAKLGSIDDVSISASNSQAGAEHMGIKVRFVQARERKEDA